ncbi:MAG: DUF2927 domain-containing protein [Maledivibacter sp.]|nr:DUF2927 domain-containing protein [Maledivibacter sp.]
MVTNNKNEISRTKIYISSNIKNKKDRDHIIREELTQSLGLLNDTYQYPKSIFYQGKSSVVEYLDIDKALIKMLYEEAIQLGMDRDEVIEVLNNLKKE